MSKVVQFPVHRATRATLATDPCRARPASDAINAAVTPARLTRGRAKMADHQTAGIESRCRHFSTAAPVKSAGLAISDAIASGVGHKSMMERNDRGAGMPESLGQNVLNHKANLSRDCEAVRVEKAPMVKGSTKSAFKAAFIARTKQARIARGYSQEQMAALLDMPQGTYKQYESRSLLPHDLIPRFSLLCGLDANWLFTDATGLVSRGDRPRSRGGPRTAAKKAKVA